MDLQNNYRDLKRHLDRASHDAQENLNKLNEREMELIEYRERQESLPLSLEQYEYLRQAFVKLFYVNQSAMQFHSDVHRLEAKHVGIARLICAILQLQDEDVLEVLGGVKVYSEALQAQAAYEHVFSRDTVNNWLRMLPGISSQSSSTSNETPAPTPASTPLKSDLSMANVSVDGDEAS